MSFGNDELGSDNSCAVLIGLSGVFLTIDCVGDGVAVYCILRRDGQIALHIAEIGIPSGKGIAFTSGSSGFNCGSAMGYVLCG